ncbi:hypothetical protein Tco_0344347, partial [Tanacetum coccineum]
IRSPGVDGLPVMPEDPYAYVVAAFQAPPSPDYVPSPKKPEQAPPSPVYVPYVPEPVYPEFMPPEDEVFPVKEQPLLVALLPTADSPGYIADSDPKEDPNEDPEEDPTNYPASEGDDNDDEDESSDDDEDDDDDETEPFKTDKSTATPPPHPAYCVTARISIRPQTPVSLPSDTKVARLLAIPTPPPSPLSPWSSPLPQIPSPPLPLILSPLPVSSPLPVPPPLTLAPPPLLVSPTYLLGTEADTPPSGTSPSGTPPLLPIPLPTSSPPLHLLSTDRRADRPKVTLPPRKRVDFGFVATMDREIIQNLERDVSYGITDTWDEMLDTDEIYTRLDDEQTKRQLMAGRLNMLYRDRRAHARIALMMEIEAGMSRKAWGRSMDASDHARSKVMSLRTTVLGQQVVITKLQVADHRRQAAITELLVADRKRHAQFIEALKLLKRLQTQMTEFQRQQGPAKGPAQPDAPEEAGSSP